MAPMSGHLGATGLPNNLTPARVEPTAIMPVSDTMAPCAGPFTPQGWENKLAQARAPSARARAREEEVLPRKGSGASQGCWKTITLERARTQHMHACERNDGTREWLLGATGLPHKLAQARAEPPPVR